MLNSQIYAYKKESNSSIIDFINIENIYKINYR